MQQESFCGRGGSTATVGAEAEFRESWLGKSDVIKRLKEVLGEMTVVV
jgi:hypothetical protein